jgi:TIR domain
MADIFISYASADQVTAHRLADRLGESGYTVWWDRTIPPGRQFDEVIQEALNVAKCVIVLWSAESVRSNWVKTEAAEALKAGKLVPALIDSVLPPLEFKRIQAADLSQWSGDREHPEYRSFLGSIQRIVQGAHPREHHADGRADRRGKQRLSRFASNRALPWAAVAIVSAILGAAIFSLLTDRNGRTASADPSSRPIDQSKLASPAAPPASVADGGSVERTMAQKPSPATDVDQRKGRRVNLLSSEAGGEIVTAPSEYWSGAVDGSDSHAALFIEPGQEAVFAFQGNRQATFDAVAILIARKDSTNVREFELLAGNESPTADFDSIGVFTTQNLRMMKDPYQEFSFPTVRAKFLKLRALKSHGAPVMGINEIRLFGTVN